MLLLSFFGDTLGQILEQETFVHDDNLNNITQMRKPGKFQVVLVYFPRQSDNAHGEIDHYLFRCYPSPNPCFTLLDQADVRQALH
jgi:hypothetical protein